ncbi:MAG: cysteine desulfurase family protein [Actinomycetota bacterium]
MHYFDYAATSPILDDVLEAMLPYLREGFGNPSSVYAVGRESKKGIEQAREQVADAIGANPSQVIFTAGGTEADNLALKGSAGKSEAGHIITTGIEHHAVLHSARWLESQGSTLTVLRVSGDGVVDLDALEAALTPRTRLVSIMLVNNELGSIQPVAEAVNLIREKSKALVHTDAVQGLGKMKVDVDDLGVDLASFSAHKLGGPKGTGALFVKRGTPLEPLFHGGGQERDLRSGTPNVAGIVGFGVAAQIAAKEVDEEAERLGKLRDDLQERLLTLIDGVTVNAAHAPRIPGTLSVNIAGVEGESLLLMLDSNDIAASSGSACASGSLDPSHVLLAIGVPTALAHGSLRLSLGRATTTANIDHLLGCLPKVVAKLRSIPARPARPAGPARRRR